MERNEILKMINSDPDLINSAEAYMYRGKTFAIVRYGSSIDTFIKTIKGAKGYINRQCSNIYLDEATGNMTSVGAGKSIMEIKETEVYDISDKGVWYRYIENLFRKNWLETNDVIWEVKKYCRSNQDTVNFVTELITKIKNDNYVSMPIYKEYDYKEEPEQVEEVKEEQPTETTTEVTNNDKEGNYETVKSEPVKVVYNPKFNNYDLYFDKKPSQETLSELRKNAHWYGCKWSLKNNNYLENLIKLDNEESNSEVSEEPKTIESETTSKANEIKVIEQIPEVAKESDILNNIKTVALNPDKYVFIFAAKDIKDKRSLINRCCITTLKIVNNEQFNYIIANSDKNLFEIEEGKHAFNENEKEYINSILIYNKDKHQVKVILNNKVLQFFENRKGSIVKLVKPYKLDKKEITKIEVKEEKNNNCITPEIAAIQTTITESEKIKNNFKEVIKPIEKNYEILINEDIEKYKIDKRLNERVNSVSFFNSSDRDYNKELKEFLNGCKDEGLKVINMTNDLNMKEKVLSYLKSFNKKYYESYTKILNHRSNNPSWAVTGRSGLNVRKYNKALDRYDNLLLENNSLVESFNNKISTFRTKIKRDKRQAINNKIDSFTKNNNTKLKFEKTKIKIKCSNIYNIFDNGNYETIAYKYDNYYIIKNWGYWRIYNAEGNEIKVIRTNTTLKAAKEYLTYIINQAA